MNCINKMQNLTGHHQQITQKCFLCSLKASVATQNKLYKHIIIIRANMRSFSSHDPPQDLCDSSHPEMKVIHVFCNTKGFLHPIPLETQDQKKKPSVFDTLTAFTSSQTMAISQEQELCSRNIRDESNKLLLSSNPWTPTNRHMDRISCKNTADVAMQQFPPVSGERVE